MTNPDRTHIVYTFAANAIEARTANGYDDVDDALQAGVDRIKAAADDEILPYLWQVETTLAEWDARYTIVQHMAAVTADAAAHGVVFAQPRADVYDLATYLAADRGTPDQTREVAAQHGLKPYRVEVDIRVIPLDPDPLPMAPDEQPYPGTVFTDDAGA